MALNGLLQDGARAREGGGQRVREPLRQFRAALDVGEEEGDGAGGES